MNNSIRLGKFQDQYGTIFTVVVNREYDSPYDVADRMDSTFIGWAD